MAQFPRQILEHAACLHSSVQELAANKRHVRVIGNVCVTKAAYVVQLGLLRLCLQLGLESYAVL